MDILAQLNAESMAAKGGSLPDFIAGDTLRVHVTVTEGNRTRIQVFEGLCIARHNKGIGSSFTVRKLSFGEGVERVFPLYSPVIDKIEVVRKGDVRRAKLYYLRGRTGKAARISEKARALLGNQAEAAAVPAAAAVEAPAETAANVEAPAEQANA